VRPFKNSIGEYLTAILKASRIIIFYPRCFTLTAWKIAIRTALQRFLLKVPKPNQLGLLFGPSIIYFGLQVYIFVKIF
jgi:hypothetical protein